MPCEASEGFTSPWAPATVLIEDGLRRAGHHRLVDEISARFRALCEAYGFAENFPRSQKLNPTLESDTDTGSISRCRA